MSFFLILWNFSFIFSRKITQKFFYGFFRKITQNKFLFLYSLEKLTKNCFSNCFLPKNHPEILFSSLISENCFFFSFYRPEFFSYLSKIVLIFFFFYLRKISQKIFLFRISFKKFFCFLYSLEKLTEKFYFLISLKKLLKKFFF